MIGWSNTHRATLKESLRPLAELYSQAAGSCELLRRLNGNNLSRARRHHGKPFMRLRRCDKLAVILEKPSGEFPISSATWSAL